MTNAHEYDVVISFAGQDRKSAQDLAEELKRQDLKVFYDFYKEAELVSEPLKQKLRNIYESRGRFCIVLLSRNYKPNDGWTGIELQAALTRISSGSEPYIIPIRLDSTPVPPQLSTIGFLSWPPHNVQSTTNIVLKKLGKSHRWDEVLIRTSRNQQGTLNEIFTDIAWLGLEGWLCVALHIGGGYGPVGEGAILHTPDSGKSWMEIDKSLFPSGSGRFTWGPQGTRYYDWNEIGPVFSVYAYQRRGLDSRPQLWIASSTGIYRTEDGGLSWHRSTPGPDHPDRYAFFFNTANIEAFSEVYAVGWQGIAHWTSRSNRWELLLPTYSYPISAVCVLGGSENRNVWAVGRAGRDAAGNWGSDSHGAIYRLMAPSFRDWEQVDLRKVKFRMAQSLNDIIMPDLETIIAVGDQGMIIRGLRENSSWDWVQIASPTTANLNSAAQCSGTLWAVGNEGVILSSVDRGLTWKVNFEKRDDHNNKPVLRRIRFQGDEGWVLGDSVVLKSSKL